MGSFPQPWTLLPPISAAVVALVRGMTDDPERRGTRRQGVCHAVQGWLGPFAAGGCQQLTGRITLSNRNVPGERAPSPFCAAVGPKRHQPGESAEPTDLGQQAYGQARDMPETLYGSVSARRSRAIAGG